MAALRAEDIADLANATINNFDKGKIQQIAQSNVDYPLLQALFLGDGQSSNSRWFNADGGQKIQRQVQYKVSDIARHVGLHEDDVINITDVTETLEVRWAYATTNWSFSELEFIHNKGDARIFNLMMPRMTDAKLSLLEDISRLAWQSPGTSGDDLKKPFGIPYWIVKGSNGENGHVGGHPTGHSDVGGINTSTVTTFKNWFSDYALVTKADLIKKMRKAWRKCKYRSPVQVNEHSVGPHGRYKFYGAEAVTEEFEALAEGQNENLGKDLAPYENSARMGIGQYNDAVLFRKSPICYEPELDSDTSNPLYGLDMASIKVAVAKGWDFKKSPVERAATRHLTFVQHIDIAYQYLCVDRRRQMVFAVVA